LNMDGILRKGSAAKDEDEAPIIQKKKKNVKKGSILTTQKRPCPICSKPINVRAIKCIHCKKIVAKQIECENCGSKLPDDLDECWNCGIIIDHGIEETVDEIECEECYEYTGPISESTPCPICGWYPGQEVVHEVHEEHDDTYQDEPDFSSDDEYDNHSVEYEESYDTSNENYRYDDMGGIDDMDDIEEIEESDDVDFDEAYEYEYEDNQREVYVNQQKSRTQQKQKSQPQTRTKPQQKQQSRTASNPKKHQQRRSQEKLQVQQKAIIKPNEKTHVSMTEEKDITPKMTAKAKTSNANLRVKQKIEQQTAERTQPEPSLKSEPEVKKSNEKTKAQKIKSQKVQEMVECPTCYETVPKGPVCEKCGEYL